MQEKDKNNTEWRILEAAKKVFVLKGKDGARMQEIADTAGINKSLLHYYYRSKEKLFHAVFRFAISVSAPKMFEIFSSGANSFNAIEVFISEYMDLLKKHPFIPMFILGEVSKKETHFVIDVIKNSGVNVDGFCRLIEHDIENGLLRKNINPKELLVNIISLCVFPVIGRPLLGVIIFDNDTAKYDAFLNDRKRQVTDLIIHSIATNYSNYQKK